MELTLQNPKTGHWLGTIVGERDGKMVVRFNTHLQECSQEIHDFLERWGDGIIVDLGWVSPPPLDISGVAADTHQRAMHEVRSNTI